MRDIRTTGLATSDENIPTTTPTIDGDEAANPPMESDENKTAKRFAKRTTQPEPATHDRKENN